MQCQLHNHQPDDQLLAHSALRELAAQLHTLQTVLMLGCSVQATAAAAATSLPHIDALLPGEVTMLTSADAPVLTVLQVQLPADSSSQQPPVQDKLRLWRAAVESTAALGHTMVRPEQQMPMQWPCRSTQYMVTVLNGVACCL